MGQPSTQEIEQRIAVLRQAYYEELPAKLDKLALLWQTVKAKPQTRQIESLHHAIHSLAGSGATFGIEKISVLARSIEHYLKRLMEESRPFSDDEQVTLDELFHQLCQQPEQGFEEDRIELTSPVETAEKQLIYVVEDNRHVADALALELTKENYKVEVFNEPKIFKQAFQDRMPSAIIMDIVFPESSEGGTEAIDELSDIYESMPPVIYLSIRSDIKARLAAVKTGATRYFTKPVNYRKLVTSLNGLTNRVLHHPYRVLIVDDDGLLSDYYATMLQGAGMDTRIINDPLQLLETLDEYKPDLVLMDVYMPNCSGLELASVIRQDDSYLSLPIVFLSTEADIDKQLYAMDLGGDDFLTKPIMPAHLINAVSVRVKRARRQTRLNQDLELALLQNKQQRTELAKKEERLRYSQMFANIGSWDLDIRSNRMIWSDRIGPLLGLTNEQSLTTHKTYEFFFESIHPDDREHVTQAIQSCIAGQSQYDIEHRVIWADGSIHWLLQRGDVIRDEQGNPVRMLGVVLDTTQRKQLERDLATQKDLAEDASRAKSDFLSRMSHELRTPLNAIIGFSQLLESDTEFPLLTPQQDSLGEILRASNHLLDLIDEVLDLARIEAGKMKLKLEELDLTDILLDCYSLMSPIAESCHIQLDLAVEECAGVKVRADRTRLRQVMLNLLSNAIKYNSENGKVKIRCDTYSLSRIRINVVDTGPGIPDQRQSELFQAFNRLGAETSEVEGTGIGLMITKRLTEMMGGEIGFSSKTDEGSVFWLELVRTDIGTESREGQILQVDSGDLPGPVPVRGQVAAKK